MFQVIPSIYQNAAFEHNKAFWLVRLITPEISRPLHEGND